MPEEPFFRGCKALGDLRMCFDPAMSPRFTVAGRRQSGRGSEDSHHAKRPRILIRSLDGRLFLSSGSSAPRGASTKKCEVSQGDAAGERED